MIFRSLGRRVLLAGVSKEVRLKLKLSYDPEVFPIGEDHIVLRLSSIGDCARVKGGGSWFIEGQLMALDKWVPDFLPARQPIHKTVVWIHLPELPLEYWLPSTIMAMAGEAGNPLSIDNFIDQLRKWAMLGFGCSWMRLSH